MNKDSCKDSSTVHKDLHYVLESGKLHVYFLLYTQIYKELLSVVRYVSSSVPVESSTGVEIMGASSVV